MKKTVYLIAFGACLYVQAITDLQFYLGDLSHYEQTTPKPIDILGYEVGEWHVRHDQLIQYMTRLADASSRAVLEPIGRTHENRQLVHLVISSPANIARLEEIRKAHVTAAKGDQLNGSEDLPIVVYLGYSIHGNEPSGANASMLMAYHLAASNQIDTLLNHTIVIIDPSMNPDGLSRFAQWANMHRGKVLVADKWHREHVENWPSGRTNHYWYDLNRDWLLLQHPESRARVERFHHWRPNILSDFHEMGTESSYFFQPGVPSRQNPLTPDQNLALTRTIARYHAKAFDKDGKLYFTEQQFDDFYYGKGSTYPDIQGSIGILFEQASSRGHLQNNSYGELSFPQTIKNQLTASLSTLQAGLENRSAIKAYQASFFPTVLEQAKKYSVKAYVFGDNSEAYRAREMAAILTRHQVQVYQLARPLTANGKRLDKGYVVPCDQAQFLLIKSVFDQVTTFNDNTFYDVSTWHFPSAFGVVFAELNQKQFQSNLLGNLFDPNQNVSFNAKLTRDELAFAIDWRHYLAPKIAYRLMAKGYRVRGATEPFTAETSVGTIKFGYGTLLIHMGTQKQEPEGLLAILKEATNLGVPVFGLQSGLTIHGHDLGSNSFIALKKPKVALMVGKGVSIAEAGEIWHLLDHRFEMPLALIEKDKMNENVLKEFTHVIMVDGQYASLDESFSTDLGNWINGGGHLIAVKRAAQWVADQGILNIKLDVNGVKKEKDTKQENPVRLPYGERAQRKALNLIGGTIFNANLDTTHPLAFGYERPQIALFRNHSRVMQVSKDPYATVAAYTVDPLLSGYVSQKNLARIRETAAIIAMGKQRGGVVAMMDDPSFRGFWLGTQRLLLNALFYSGHIQAKP